MGSDDLRSQLQMVLLEEIPLTRAMGLTVAEAGPNRVALKAPLEPNHNHKRTAFGGSLYSLAVLAGWSLLWIRLKQSGLKGHVVIARSEVEYLRPVVDDLIATAEAEETVLAQALEVYRRRGKSKILIRSVVAAKGEAGLKFSGTYALLK